MIVNNIMEVLKGLSGSKVGEISEGKFLRFFPVSGFDRGMEDIVLSTLETARRTQCPCNKNVEFMFYQLNSDEKLIVLCGNSAEEVAYFDFRAIGEQINTIITELLSGWQTYDLSCGDVLYQVQDKVVEITLEHIEPISDAVIVKSFTFGRVVGEDNTASNMAKYIIDILYHTDSSKSLLPVRANDAGSTVIARPEIVDYLRSFFIEKPISPTKNSFWKKITGG